MTTRREFLQTTAGAGAGLMFVGCDLMTAAPTHAQARRRQVVVNGKRVKTVDVHAHCAVPEALALMNLKLGGPGLRPDLDMAAQVPARLQAMDEQGVDDLCAGGTHGPIKKTPSDYLKQMYYDTMVFNPEGVRHLAAEVGASRLLVGTDFPYPWTRTAMDLILDTPGLSDADKAAILGGNAAGLLGIKT